MSRRVWALIGVVAVVAVVAGFIAMHMSKAAASTASKTTSAPAASGAVIVTKTSSTLGDYLTDPSGKALYTSAGDTNGMSNCTGACLSAWPAYIDSGSTANLPAGVGTITRTDNGKTQYTFKGLPLYYFASDASGDATGNGVGGFHLAKPTSSQSASAPSTSAPGPTPAPTTAPATSPTSGGSSW